MLTNDFFIRDVLRRKVKTPPYSRDKVTIGDGNFDHFGSGVMLSTMLQILIEGGLINISSLVENTHTITDASGVILVINYYGGTSTDTALLPTMVVDETAGTATITVKEETKPIGFELYVPSNAVNDSTSSFTINVVSENDEVHRFISKEFLNANGQHVTSQFGLSPTISNTADTFSTIYSNANIDLKILASFCS